jgi:photosystem I P700 chlorophyll a apoprotein A2
MATKFPKFSQALAQDPTTRRIWYGIATAHDFESHDGMTEENLYQKIFASHFGHLAIIFLWTSGNLFHVAWQGNFEQWIKDPLNVRPIAHAIWDPHFGQPAVDAFTQAGASSPVNIAFSGVYHWWYTIGMRTNADLYTGAVFLLILSAVFLFAGWLHLQPKFRPSLSWFKNAESRLNHHLAGLFGVSSLLGLVTWFTSPSPSLAGCMLVGTTSCPRRLIRQALRLSLPVIGGCMPRILTPWIISLGPPLVPVQLS